MCPTPPDNETPPMLVNEISRLFFACMRKYTGDSTGVMAQNSARFLMGYLVRHEGVSQNDLVKATRLKPPTVSIVLRQMEEEGLVERRADKKDRRTVHVYLTEAGHRHERMVCDSLRRADRLLMKDFSDEEYEIAKQVLLRMRNNILEDLTPAERERFPERNGDERP